MGHDKNENKVPKLEFGFYHPLDFFTIRAPLLPIEHYRALAESPADKRSIRSLVSAHPKIDRALAIGNPSFHDAICSVTKRREQPTAGHSENNGHSKEGPAEKDEEKILGKLLRLIIRMSTRPTPLGLYAGVALGEFGDSSNMKIAETGLSTRSRLDMELVAKLAFSLEPQFLKQLELVVNPSVVQFADRIYLIEKAPIFDEQFVNGMSIEATEEVLNVIALSQKPISFEKLAKAVAKKSEYDKEDIDDMIAQMAEATILLTNLRPNTFNPKTGENLIAALSRIPEAREQYEKLDQIVIGLRNFDSHGCTTNGVADFKELLKTGAEVHNATAYVQTDMALTMDGARLTKTIGVEAAKVLELIANINNNMQSRNLDSYRLRFLEKYESREVPLLELLNPDFGLGFPAAAEPVSQPANVKRISMLSDLINGAIKDGKREVEIDTNFVNKFLEAPAEDLRLPITCDMFAQVFANSLEDIDAGRYQLMMTGASPGGGRNLGRFADMLGEQGIAALKKITEKEQELLPDNAHADLTSLPRTFRLGNVCTIPPVRPYQVTLDSWSSPGNAQTITLNDLIVGLRNNRFYLRSASLGKEVTLSAPHLANPIFNTAIARFLRDICDDGICTIGKFNFAELNSSLFTPRVTFGKFILSPATWVLRVTDELRTMFKSEQKFFSWLGEWRERWLLPRHVYLTQFDNKLLLDLEDWQQANEFRKEVLETKDKQIVLQETFAELNHLWLLGPGGHYTDELVLTFALSPERVQAQQKKFAIIKEVLDPKTITDSDRYRRPGSDWLFAKIYVGKSLEDEVIASVLRDFALESVRKGLAENWFFIRYLDPDSHIRLRFNGDPQVLERKLYPKLLAFFEKIRSMGYCRKFTIDTYEREVERYGGLKAIQYAEQLFGADSEWTAQLLQFECGEEYEIDRLNMCALTIDKLLAALGLDDRQRLEWYKKFAKKRADVGPAYRTRKDALMALFLEKEDVYPDVLRSTNDDFTAKVKKVGAAYRRLQKAGSLAYPFDSIIRSFVHMHCNRYLGVELEQEDEAVALACRVREGLSSVARASI